MAVSSTNRSNTLGVNEGAPVGKQAHSARRNVRSNFLTATFGDIPGYTLPVNEAAIVIGTPEDDISRLRFDVKFFYDQMEIDAELPEMAGNFQRDVKSLYTHVREHLPEDWYVDIIRESGGDSPIKFVVYKFHKDFPDFTVWCVPIAKLESVDEMTKRLLLITFAMLHRCDMFTYPDDNYDMQYALGQLDYDFGHTDENGEVVFDENAEWWDDDYKEWALRYVKGDIYELFQEIKYVEQSELDGEGQLTTRLAKMIEEYRKEGYHNPQLLNIVEDLLELCEEEWLSDYHISITRSQFGEDFASEEEQSEEVMDFDRMFFFVYDQNDPICNNVIDMFNADAGNIDTGAMLSYSFIDRADVKERLENSFPERWAQVHQKFIDEIQK